MYDVKRFLGIRFAQPPVGPLRFRPAQPFTATEPETLALDFGPSCLQGKKKKKNLTVLTTHNTNRREKRERQEK